MELSEETLQSLRLLGKQSSVCASCFGQILEIAASSVVKKGEKENQNVSSCKECDTLTLKSGLSGCCSLLIESVRHGIESSEVQSILEQNEWNNERVQLFTEMYTKEKHEILKVLKSIGSHPPHIVDVDWRMDYCIKNSSVDHVGSPFYLIDLKSSDKNKETIQFACSLEELQDLVGKLKEAVKCVERLAT